MAASSLAASFLGQQAFQHPSPRGLAITALVAFVISIAASVFILLPKKNLIFAEAGAGLYEGLYAFRDDMPEVYRRLAYDLDLFWDSNDTKIKWLTHAYTVAATALVVEILSLAALLGENIFKRWQKHQSPKLEVAELPRPPLRLLQASVVPRLAAADLGQFRRAR